MAFVEERLSVILKEFGEKETETVLSEFVCDDNKEVEEFIRKKAIKHENDGMSKTILIFDNDTDDIVGYYTITTKSFLLHKMNTSKKRKFFGTSQTNGNVLPSILIGQLGKNSATKSKFTGSNLMDCIFRYIFKMSEYTPSVVCYVEHNGSEKLINCYVMTNVK